MKVARVRSSSIRIRLSLLLVLNSSIALTLAGFGLFGYESIREHAAEVRQLNAEAEIIADASTPALSFGNRRAAARMLGELRDNTRQVEAVIYDRHDQPFARYEPEGSPQVSAVPLRKDGVYFENNALLVFRPIMSGEQRIGTVFIKSRNEVFIRLRRYIVILCFVLSVSLVLALLLSSRTQSNISEPIAELSALARRVSIERDYSVRARPASGGGEIGILIDSFNQMLSQIETHEENLRESEERYALAARGANDGLWDWRLATNKIYFSPRFKQMLGYSASDSWSSPEEWFSRIHEADRERVKAELAIHIDGRTSEFAAEYRMRHSHGGFIWTLSRGFAVRNGEGMAIRMAGTQTDVTESRIGDALTGLPNRLYLLSRIEDSLEKACVARSSFGVLVLDLDRFNLVNNSFGQRSADRLLVAVADRLRHTVRTNNRAWDFQQDVLARLGEDEFAVLLSQVTDVTDVVAVAQCLVKDLDTPFEIDGRQVFATACIGIAMSSPGDSPEDILRNADTAMYHAKTKGKARFQVFDKSMRERAVARLQIETGLRKAIEEEQLLLYYQPEISLRSQRVIGYEALVRWNHPELGFLNPSEFVSIAEESDLIVPLGRWVLREATRQMAQWQRDLAFDPPLTVSVNVSARQLTDPGFVLDVESALEESGLDPAFLKLEITESSIMENPEITLATLRRLKLLDVGLEIDDFGTGYSSLSHLQKLPFDTVKVDRSFVKELASGAESFEIVRTIVDLARSLNMYVVAEGVETGDQLEKLAALGCDYAQGFYFARPLSPETTFALMRERRHLERCFHALERAGPAPGGDERIDTESDGSFSPALLTSLSGSLVQ